MRPSSEVFMGPGDERVEKAMSGSPREGRRAEEDFRLKTGCIPLMFLLFSLGS